MVRLSIWAESRAEIDRHKWIESLHAGYDKGENAVRDWIGVHWQGYLRAKWLEHLQGTAFWIELDRSNYGKLRTDFRDRDLLLDRIIDRFKAGQENLHIILWAHDWHIPMGDVLDILEALDVNSTRLVYHFNG